MFAAPAWLWALLALAVPLALHLWSRRPNTVIRVSSLRHLLDLPTARRWSRKLTEPLLLLLRLAVVALLALALARPRLAGFSASHRGPVVLLDPKLLTDSQTLATDPLLDSLRRAGEKVRLLAAGFPASPIAKPAWYKEEPTALWDLIAQADRRLAPDDGLLVIARPSPDRLGGVRPRLSTTLQWHIPMSPSSGGWWIGDARRLGDEIRMWLYHGDARHIASHAVTTPARPGIVRPADSPAFEIDSGVSRLRMLADSRQPTAVSRQSSSGWIEIQPTSVRRITIDSALPETQAARLRLAATAVAAEVGDSLLFTPAKADLQLPAGFSDSVILSPALADSVLARWPIRLGMSRDPRAVGLAQLEPVHARTPGRSRPGDAMRWLLVLAGIVLLAERWLATRRGPGRAL